LRKIIDDIYLLDIETFKEVFEHVEIINKDPDCPESVNTLYEEMKEYSKFAMSQNPTSLELGEKLISSMKLKDYDKAKKIIFLISNSLTYFKREDLSELVLKMKEYAKPPKVIKYIEDLCEVWELSRTREYYARPIAIRDVFEDYGLEVPHRFVPIYDHIVEHQDDLKRTGIFEDLSYRILAEIRCDNELEDWLKRYDELDLWEKTRIKVFLEVNKEYLEYEPKYILLKEKIDTDLELKRDKGSSPL